MNLQTNKIWCQGASEIAKAVREKIVTCCDVVHAHLERISLVNEQVNAVTVVLQKEALSLAAELDRMIARNEPLGPLAGLPFTVKENIDLAGSATTFGMIAMKNAMPAADAPHISQLKRAGAIPIARTNLSEMGLRPHTVNPLRGATVNPWQADRTPGGSSGGDAVAVATGMAAFGVGNDYGGSLRCPAQFCGVASIKPSLGRVPDHMSLMPSEPAMTLQLFMSQGPIARCTEDLRLALACMCGPDARDPRWVPAPLNNEKSPKPIRVAVTIDPAAQGVDAQVAQGVQQAAHYLADAGYEVEEVEPPSIMQAWETWGRLTGVEIGILTIPMVAPFASSDSMKFLRNWADLFPDKDLPTYMEGLAMRNHLARQWARFMEKYPLILGPVLAAASPRVGFDVGAAEDVRQFILDSRLVVIANLLGLPAAVIPVGIADGLPQAAQIIGARFREDLCLDAAQAIEHRCGIITPIDLTA